VTGNPTLLKELIRNLVDNAINYTPSSAEHPGVVTARVLVDPIGRVALLQVEDSGPGIPEAERELVFQPFYRSLGTNVDGSGLGLPIVLEIAQQHEAQVCRPALVRTCSSPLQATPSQTPSVPSLSTTSRPRSTSRAAKRSANCAKPCASKASTVRTSGSASSRSTSGAVASGRHWCSQAGGVRMPSDSRAPMLMPMPMTT
jgi:hypothetical protein